MPLPSKWTPAPPTTEEIDELDQLLSRSTERHGSEPAAVAYLLSALSRRAAKLDLNEMAVADAVFNAYRDAEL